jgi:hypothetical protein
MLEMNLKAAIKRTQSLEAEKIERNCAWKRYNRVKRKMETDLRSDTK